DSGMTLVEVIVAIAILAIVTSASVGLIISSSASAATIQRRQVALTIASGALESVSAQPALAVATTNGLSYLFTGRSQTGVMARWTPMSGQPGVSQTYPTWDPNAASAKSIVIPYTWTPPSTSSQNTSTYAANGTTYTASMLLGTCYQPLSGTGGCSTVPGASATTTPVGYTPLVRAIVVVSWTAGADCVKSACSYVASTLLDPNSDLQWVTHG
ncbi:MAG: type II secretion system protein, partial [Leifsonia sp.]